MLVSKTVDLTETEGLIFLPYLLKFAFIYLFQNANGPASYYGVFDGHNGCDAATYANCHLHHYLVQSVHYPHNPEAALREAFTTTDKRFIEKTAKGVSIRNCILEIKIYVSEFSILSVFKNIHKSPKNNEQ